MEDEFIQSAIDGNLEKVKEFVVAGVNIHAENDKALYWAIYRKHFAVVEYLLENRLDGHVYTDQSLYNSIVYERIDFVKLLLEHGIVPTQNCLSVAVEIGNVEIMKLLLDYGNLDFTSEAGGITLAELLGESGHYRQMNILKLLLDYGASRDIAISLGVSTLEHLSQGSTERIKLCEMLMKIYNYIPVNPRCVIF